MTEPRCVRLCAPQRFFVGKKEWGGMEMSRLDSALAGLKDIKGGKMWERLRHELRYARRVSQALAGKHEALILTAVEQVRASAAREGVVTDQRALEIENTLLPMQADCKKYKLMICGHAHIDMNWMWRYDETVQITLDTFRTVLTLMKEFPRFTFSQSQASVYRIAEEFAPEMLDEIRQRAREGRWEVTASTWVEADRNMPNAESTARHHLYTADYLRSLGLTPSRVDFEPDTFGHHQNTPELLSQAGVKYYYHCRGLDDQTLYRWRAPSGAEVLAYCEPFWYNGSIDGDFAEYAPAFCEQFGVEYALRVYGVGDHGGGPTRRDIQRAIDMQSWPIYATVEFGTFHRFFESAARATKEIPVVDRELNPLFLGCYTTQTRVKKGNRYAERLLAEAEQLNAFAWRAVGAPYRAEKFREGWRNVLFNQFHDILPGSGVTDTREYAMGLYQQAYAVANSARRQAMKAIADRIDTSAFAAAPGPEDTGTGAGVGYGVEETLDPAPVEVGGGKTRLFHLFNSCAFDRRETVELTVWDLKASAADIAVTDEKGSPLPFQVIGSGRNDYWGHDFTRVMVTASVPAMGYATCVVGPKEDVEEPIPFTHDWRVERDEDWTIENDRFTVQCDPNANMGAIVLTEKAGGEIHIIDGFRFAIEDGARGMTAWVTGDDVNNRRVGDIRMRRTVRGPLYNELEATAQFGRDSEITYTIGLRNGADWVDIGARVRWLEPGDPKEQLIPQLSFRVMADEVEASKYLYDIPGGVLTRPASTQELPGLRFIAGGRLALMTDSKYGYRGDVGFMGVTLIRSSYNPDEYPELGAHSFRVAVGLAESEKPEDLIRMAQRFQSHIVTVTNTTHPGDMPLSHGFARLVAGSVELMSVKRAEDGKGLILRGVELTGDGRGVVIELEGARGAALCDTHERPVQPLIVSDGAICFDARPHGLFTIRATFDERSDA